MQFDSLGNVYPYKIIETTFDDLYLFFLQNNIFTKKREILLNQLSDFLNKLTSLLNSSFYIWIDGSFITQKNSPNDVDILIFIHTNDLLEKQKELSSLRKEYRKTIDSYFIEICEENSPNFHLFEMNKKEWYFLFSTSRDFKSKGIFQINFNAND